MWNSIYLALSSVILLAGSARGESAETGRKAPRIQQRKITIIDGKGGSLKSGCDKHGF